MGEHLTQVTSNMFSPKLVLCVCVLFSSAWKPHQNQNQILNRNLNLNRRDSSAVFIPHSILKTTTMEEGIGCGDGQRDLHHRRNLGANMGTLGRIFSNLSVHWLFNPFNFFNYFLCRFLLPHQHGPEVHTTRNCNIKTENMFNHSMFIFNFDSIFSFIFLLSLRKSQNDLIWSIRP